LCVCVRVVCVCVYVCTNRGFMLRACTLFVCVSMHECECVCTKRGVYVKGLCFICVRECA